MTVTRDALKISLQISELLQGGNELPAGGDKPGSDHSRSQVRDAKHCLLPCLQNASSLEVLIKTLEQ